MKRIYLSFPISGKDIRMVERVAAQATETVLRYFPGCEVVNPLELCRDIASDSTLTEEEKYRQEMIRDLSVLLQCDGIVYVTSIGKMSNGCMAEDEIADTWNRYIPKYRIRKFALFEDSIAEQSEAV